MAKKNAINLEKGVFQKSLLILLVLVAIVAGSAGFFYGKIFTQPSLSAQHNDDWITYEFAEGLRMKYPSDMRVSQGYMDDTEFTKSWRDDPQILRVALVDAVYQGTSVSSKYPDIAFYLLPNPTGKTFDEWVSDWHKEITTTDYRLAGPTTQPERVTIGNRTGLVVRDGERRESQIVYVFVPLKFDRIVVGILKNHASYLDNNYVPINTQPTIAGNKKKREDSEQNTSLNVQPTLNPTEAPTAQDIEAAINKAMESEQFLYSILATIDDSVLEMEYRDKMGNPLTPLP